MNPKIIIAAAILLSAIPAIAGTTVPSLPEAQPVATTAESGWEVRAALYGWGTALDGDVTLRGNNAPVDAGFDDVLDNLDYAVMGVVEIGRGKWSFLADLFFAQLGTSGSERDLDYDIQLTQFIGNFSITYNVINDDRTRFDIFAGARVNSLDADLDITRTGILRERTFSGSDSKTWVDPIIGARFQQELSDRFFVRALADIGGFGVSSDLTWQALAAFGYHISDSASVAIGYRGIGTDYEDGDFGYDVVSHGLLLGFEYKF